MRMISMWIFEEVRDIILSDPDFDLSQHFDLLGCDGLYWMSRERYPIV
jgi:hypothetical protein